MSDSSVWSILFGKRSKKPRMTTEQQALTKGNASPSTNNALVRTASSTSQDEAVHEMASDDVSTEPARNSVPADRASNNGRFSDREDMNSLVSNTARDPRYTEPQVSDRAKQLNGSLNESPGSSEGSWEKPKASGNSAQWNGHGNAESVKAFWG